MEKKEAMKILKDFHDKSALFSVRTALDTIIPELKESEDERIRKWIIDDIRYNMNNEPLNNSEYKKKAEKAIAWLEKQGEQKSTNNVEPKFRPGDRVRNKKYSLEQTLGGCIEDVYEGAFPFRIKDQDDWELVEDRIAPRFHEGNWVVDEDDNSVHQIKRVIENVTNGNFSYDLIGGGYFPSIKKNYHLWSIKDAKDGDVLVCNKELLLFKSYSVQGRISLYCWYNGQTNNFHSKEVNDTLLSTRKIYPATKEQRDTLLKAMAYAGYTRVKEDENEIEIPFGAKDSELQEATYYIPKVFHAEIDDGKVVIKKGEKPTEWSALDERNLQGIIDEIEANKNQAPDYDIETYDRFLNWLKSLRPQKQWKPSEEQMKALNYVVNLMAASESLKENDYYYNVFKDLRKQLKAL